MHDGQMAIIWSQSHPRINGYTMYKAKANFCSARIYTDLLYYLFIQYIVTVSAYTSGIPWALN